jgi:Na+-driven multidrug efflux pump
MTALVLYGAGSGALHAVSGPDHVLSLGPAALSAPRDSLRVGLLWGAGHAVGTLLLSIPVLVLTRFVSLPSLAALGERAAGFALLATALWSFWRTRSVAQRGATDSRTPVLVGLVHGATGAGSLLLVLPVIVSGDVWRATWFLLAFALGSTFGMAGLTTVIGRVGQRLEARVLRVVQSVLIGASAVLGVCWLLLP